MNHKNSEKKVKISRILEIDDEIRSGRYPNSEYLAKKLELNSRTIKRYIDYLKKYYNAPIGYNSSRRGFYYTQPNFFIKNVMLTKEENDIVLNSFFFSDEDDTETDNEFQLNLKKSFSKIVRFESKDPGNNIPRNKAEKNKYLNDFLSQPNQNGIIDELNKAIKNRKVVEIDYWMSDRRDYILHNIKPLHVFFEKHWYYLLALNDMDKPGVYAIYKIRNIHTKDESFKIPADLVISDYRKESAAVFPSDNKVYLFELSFSKVVAPVAVEYTYAKNQTVGILDDGTVFVSFRSTELYEIFHWILHLGRNVKVLNPPELKEMMKIEIQKVLKYYL